MKNNGRLCLMSCCAPCSCGAIAECIKLKDAGAISDFVVLFYNPNIFPKAEYQKRLAEQIRYCNDLGAKYQTCAWNHDEWLKCTAGLESNPEQGQRCLECFKYRFLYGINWAHNNGYDAISSVFGVSRHKNQNQVDDAAAAAVRMSGWDIKYLPIEWDENLRNEINRDSDFYRQKYCGCEYGGERLEIRD